jgi:hypothetical protein
MPTPHEKPKKSTPHRKLAIQHSPARRFKATAACKLSALKSSTTSKKLRKTPKEDAKKCLGSVRLGQDETFVYIALPHHKHNPKYSRTAFPTGSHVEAHWVKLYDTRTGKAVKAKDLPARIDLALLS